MDKYFLGAHRNSEAIECCYMTNRPEFPSVGSLSHKLSLITGKGKLSSGKFAHTIYDKTMFFVFVLLDLDIESCYCLDISTTSSKTKNWNCWHLNHCKDQ